MDEVKFEDLVGKKVAFYGVDNAAFCVRVGGSFGNERYAFEAMEDESDGYRSMMEEVKRVPLKGHIFFREPIASVLVEEDESLDGYRLTDSKDGHVWLRFGTDRADDWYPSFAFEYAPHPGRNRSGKR